MADQSARKQELQMKSLILSLSLFGFAIIVGCGTAEPTAADNGTPAKLEPGTKELPSKGKVEPPKG